MLCWVDGGGKGMGLDGEMLSGAHFISSPPSNGCYGRKYVNLCWGCAALGVTNAI